jgi:DNA ligase-1
MSNKKFLTLYIRDSKGKERQWSVRTEGADIIVSHGIVGGKITEKRTTAKGKNIGKSNETTPEQQAILEAQSKWNKQVDREDYHWDIDKAGLQLRPMLALDYLKVPHRVNWEQAVVQPKLDGLRLTVGNRYVPGGYTEGEFEMLTRKGEVYQVPHLVKPCDLLLREVNKIVDGRCLALDGEVYLHGLPLQHIVSRAKKYKEGLTEQLEFHVFDLVIPGMVFEDRYRVLIEVLSQLPDIWYSIVPVETIKCVHEDVMKQKHGEWTQKGYEGTMIRHCDSQYAIGHRSPDLFKYKEFYDDEFQIVNVWEDRNGNAMFTVEAKVGMKLTCDDHVVKERYTFDATPKRTHDERKEMLSNKDYYVGQWLTVKYQSLSEDFIPIFPVGLAIRECDEEGNPIV